MSSAATRHRRPRDTLRSTEILRGVAEPTLEKIAAAAKPQMVEEGDTLYSVGDPARSAYVVAAGRLRFILGGDGRPAAQGTIIRAGDILGWAALLGNQPRRIATVIALEKCRLLEHRRRSAAANSRSGSARRISRDAAPRPDDHAKLSRAEHACSTAQRDRSLDSAPERGGSERSEHCRVPFTLGELGLNLAAHPARFRFGRPPHPARSLAPGPPPPSEQGLPSVQSSNRM